MVDYSCSYELQTIKMDTMDNPNIAVRCCDVTKTYGTGASRVDALRGINLDVYQGELLMLIGPSGCGKTTLISIISGIMQQDGGQCEVLGQDLTALDQEAKGHFRGEKIGFVFQLFNLFPALTILENTAVPLLIKGQSRKSALTEAKAALAAVKLDSRPGAMPGELSIGQQQRVAIARALVHQPQLIVCDEPTSSLDHEAGHEAMQLLRAVANDNGRTLIIVTHDNRIIEFADRIARMEDGRIVDVTPGRTGGLLV